jgi:DNA-binding transcriptional regulator YhcF (GntR family)
MQLLSFLLSTVLGIVLIATVLLADMHTLTSSGGIKQIINAVLLPNKAPASLRPMVAAGGTVIDPGQIQLPDGAQDAILSGDSNALVDILYDTMQEMLGEENPITKDQLQTFVENSTVTDFIADKAAGYAEDILSGTENTQITAEELVQLVEENKTVIEETFEIQITEEQMDEIKTNVTTIVEENDINTTIRTEINNAMDSAVSGAAGAGVPLAEIMQIVRMLSQDTVLYMAIGACVLLLLLLCGTNFYNIPGGLTWAAVPCIFVGGILAAPVAILQLTPSILGEFASFAPMINVLAVNHYAAPIIGLVLLIGSIIWRIVRSCVENNRLNP